MTEHKQNFGRVTLPSSPWKNGKCTGRGVENAHRETPNKMQTNKRLQRRASSPPTPEFPFRDAFANV